MKQPHLAMLVAIAVVSLSACAEPVGTRSSANDPPKISATCETASATATCSNGWAIREVDWNGPAYLRGSDGGP